MTLVAGLFFTFEYAHNTMSEAAVPDSHSFDVIMSERQKVEYVFDLYICFNRFRLYRTGFLQFTRMIIIVVIYLFIYFFFTVLIRMCRVANVGEIIALFAITRRISRRVIIM